MPVAARRQVPPVGRLLVQPPQHVTGLLERRDRFEQRRHVERTFARPFVGDVGPPGEQQHRHDILGTLRTAHDVVTDGARTEFVARLGNGFEHPQAAAPDGIERAGRTLITSQQVAQLEQPLCGRQRRPAGHAEPLLDHVIVHMGMLGDIERGEMEPEGPHPAHEAPYQEIACMPAAILDQAVGRELNVREQLIRIGIAVRTSIVRGLQPLANLAEEDPVRLPIMPGGCQFLRARQQRAVGVDAPRQRRAHCNAIRALAQGLGKRNALIEVGGDDQLLMALQGVADRLAMHIGVAVHVAADPRTEMQNARHVKRLHRHRIGGGECALHLFVEQRHDAIQDLDQVEEHVLPLVGNRERFAWMILGLPDARDLELHPRPQCGGFAGGQRRIEAVEQILGDPLLLAQNGAARRFGGMGGEHRLDAEGGDQFERPLERQPVAFEPRDAVGDAARLGVGRIVQILPATADAVHLFCGIDHLEPDRKCPREIGCGCGRSIEGAPLQTAEGAPRSARIAGRLRLARLECSAPITLDQFEKILATLIAQHLADELSKFMDVLPQARVLGGEPNALPVHNARRWL